MCVCVCQWTEAQVFLFIFKRSDNFCLFVIGSVREMSQWGEVHCGIPRGSR